MDLLPNGLCCQAGCGFVGCGPNDATCECSASCDGSTGTDGDTTDVDTTSVGSCRGCQLVCRDGFRNCDMVCDSGAATTQSTTTSTTTTASTTTSAAVTTTTSPTGPGGCIPGGGTGGTSTGNDEGQGELACGQLSPAGCGENSICDGSGQAAMCTCPEVFFLLFWSVK